MTRSSSRPSFTIYEDPPPPFSDRTRDFYLARLIQNPDGTEPQILTSSIDKPEYEEMKEFYDDINYTLTPTNLSKFNNLYIPTMQNIAHLRIIFQNSTKLSFPLKHTLLAKFPPGAHTRRHHNITSLTFDFSQTPLSCIRTPTDIHRHHEEKTSFNLLKIFRLISRHSMSGVRLFRLIFNKDEGEEMRDALFEIFAPGGRLRARGRMDREGGWWEMGCLEEGGGSGEVWFGGGEVEERLGGW